jgi:hypothetical protein
MTIAAIREKLHDFVNTADDKNVKAIYTVVEELTEKSNSWVDKAGIKKIEMMKQAAIDPLFLADLKEIQDDFAHLDNESI